MLLSDVYDSILSFIFFPFNDGNGEFEMQGNCLSTEELRDLFTFHEKSRYSSFFFFPYPWLPVVIYNSRHFI